jgi:hypothetical protein
MEFVFTEKELQETMWKRGKHLYDIMDKDIELQFVDYLDDLSNLTSENIITNILYNTIQ